MKIEKILNLNWEEINNFMVKTLEIPENDNSVKKHWVIKISENRHVIVMPHVC